MKTKHVLVKVNSNKTIG